MKYTEQAGLVELYRECFPPAVQLVKRLGGNLEEAKDALHDALLIYLERKATGKLNIRTSAKAYLLGVTRIVWLHSKNRSLLPLPPEVESYIEEEQHNKEEEMQLFDYLKMAGQKCMQLLTAFYFESASLQDIASRFGFTSVRSATVQKHKCVEKIRNAVKQNHIYAEGID